MAKRKYVKFTTPEKIENINPKNKDLIKKFFSFKNMTLSDATKVNYNSDFNQFFVYILESYENKYLLDFETDDAVDLIEDYIAYSTSVLGNNERRVQRKMSSISSIYLFLRKKRRIKENPVEYLDRPKVGAGEKPQIKQTFLTRDQVEQIRKGLSEIGDIQLELMFEMGISTLLRVNALSNIKIDQIDFENKRINDILEKEGYVVRAFPSQRACDLAKQWIEQRKEKGIECEYLFVTKYNGEWKKADNSTFQGGWIKKIGNIISVPDLHMHDLRHSGADIYHKSGVALETVSKLLNHKGTDVTIRHYLQEDFDKIQDEKTKFEI